MKLEWNVGSLNSLLNYPPFNNIFKLYIDSTHHQSLLSPVISSAPSFTEVEKDWDWIAKNLLETLGESSRLYELALQLSFSVA